MSREPFAVELTKNFLKSYPDKETLRAFIGGLNVLTARERALLEMRYCDGLPLKCFAARYGLSERWAKTLAAQVIEKSSPFVYAAVVKAFAASL